jgi:hypothetical protein
MDIGLSMKKSKQSSKKKMYYTQNTLETCTNPPAVRPKAEHFCNLNDSQALTWTTKQEM